MKAAARVRAYLDAAKKNYPGVPGVNQIDDSRLLMADLEDLLASRARNAKRARRLAKAGARLSGEYAALRTENAALQEQLRKERTERSEVVAQLQTELVRERAAARDQYTEDTNEISLKFHDYRQEVDTYQKKLCNALYLPPLTSAEQILQEVQRVRQLSVTQQAETEKEFLRAQDAERQYRELRAALRQLVMDYLHPSFKDSTPDAQLAELRVLIRILQQPKPPASAGVAAISGARDYQLKAHPSLQTNTSAREVRRRGLLAAALALASGVSAIYPFGDESWRGIYRRDGRRGQLAHAGACIAALIDMLPSGVAPLDADGNVPLQEAARQAARRLVREKDHAAYPGEAGDLW